MRRGKYEIGPAGERKGGTVDQGRPRLATAAQQRAAERMRDELEGANERRAKGSVTLARVKWLERA